MDIIEPGNGRIIEKLRSIIVQMVHFEDDLPSTKYSAYLSSKMGYNYTYLANIFVKAKGMTISQFIIQNKVEYAKELLMYAELTLTQISYKLHYSSVAHLSNQFKKITGYTPSFFKNHLNEKRVNLESI